MFLYIFFHITINVQLLYSLKLLCLLQKFCFSNATYVLSWLCYNITLYMSTFAKDESNTPCWLPWAPTFTTSHFSMPAYQYRLWSMLSWGVSNYVLLDIWMPTCAPKSQYAMSIPCLLDFIAFYFLLWEFIIWQVSVRTLTHTCMYSFTKIVLN